MHSILKLCGYQSHNSTGRHPSKKKTSAEIDTYIKRMYPTHWSTQMFLTVYVVPSDGKQMCISIASSYEIG